MSETLETRLARIEGLLIMSSKAVLNVKEAAAFLGVSTSHLYHMLSDRSMPHYRKGRNVFFKKDDLEQWITSDRIASRDEIEREAARIVRSKPNYKQ